jgi:hypothetical protein
MADKPKRRSNKPEERFTIIEKTSETPMTKEEVDDLVKLMARMIAEMYISDHPELFRKPNMDSEEQED